MNTSLKRDINDAVDCLESMLAKLEKLNREDKVDLCARVIALQKTADKIEKSIKADIKAWRKGKPGNVLGETFKAVLSLVETTRLNGSALKEAEPKVWERYAETSDVERISFEPR